MAHRVGFALQLLALAISPSRRAFSQEAAAAEGNGKSSRPRCEVLSCVQKLLYFSNISQPADLQPLQESNYVKVKDH